MTTQNEEDVQNAEASEETLTTEESEAESEETDWSVKGPELEAQVAKLTNDLKSSDGQRRKQVDSERRLDEFQDELTALRKTSVALMDHLASGDMDGLAAKATEIQQEADSHNSNRGLATWVEEAQAQLLETIKDADGNLLIGKEDLDKLGASWNAAKADAEATGNRVSLRDVQIEAQKMALRQERQNAKAEQDRIRTEEKELAKREKEKSGIHNQDTGRPAGGVDTRTNHERMSEAIGRGESRIKM